MSTNKNTQSGTSSSLKADGPETAPLSITTQFFLKSTHSYVSEGFSSLLTTASFGRDLGEFSQRLVPDMLTLLNNNSIAKAEKLMLELVEDLLARLDQLARGQHPSLANNTPIVTPNLECKGALKIALSLEKLYLMEQATSCNVKQSSHQRDGRQTGLSGADGKTQDIWEKRQIKAMRKLRQQILSTLQALQVHFDIKASMQEDEGEENDSDQLAAQHQQDCNNESRKDGSMAGHNYCSFTDFVSKVVIGPFAGRMYEPLHGLATDLDLKDTLFNELKEKWAQSEGSSKRRNQRKPTTPSKILKGSQQVQATRIAKEPVSEASQKTFETKEIQTDLIPMQELSSAGPSAPSQSTHTLARRQSSQASQQDGTSLSGKINQAGSTMTQFLGSRRNKRLLIQNSELISVAVDSNQNQNQQGSQKNQINFTAGATTSKRARLATINDSDEDQLVVGNVRQNRVENSNESQADLNLVDITSSYPSCGSHSIPTTLAKRPLEQVSNLNHLPKTHSSMGFRDTAAFKQAPKNHRISSGAITGPGFLSQRSCSIDTGRAQLQQPLQQTHNQVGSFGRSATLNSRQNQVQQKQHSFQMTKKNYSRRIGGTQTQSQIKTKRPKQNNNIVSIGGVPGSSIGGINLGKKQASSQQGTAMASFLRNRQKSSGATPMQQHLQSTQQTSPFSQASKDANVLSSQQSQKTLGLNINNASNGLHRKPSTTSGAHRGGDSSGSRDDSGRTNDLDLLGL